MGRGRVLAGALLLAPMMAAATDGPHWPLDAPPVLTSSFGEFRASHLHAGLDLGTGGRVGVVCRAVDNGSIVRMRMSPFGYGKALYLQLDTGPLVVYAHLSRFASPMAGRARAEQRRRGRYTFDIEIPRGTMRVERGDVIAWSGQTGVGFPHLHFEMRDGDVARNPQTAGFAVRDTIAPVIAAIYATPMDPASHVAGGNATAKVPWGSTRAPVVVGGRIGFSMHAWDHATSRHYRQGPYRYEVRVDGRRLFSLVNDRFDYDHNHQVIFEYDRDQLVESGDRVQLLYLRPFDRLPGREAAAPGGWFVTALPVPATDAPPFGPGEHTLEVEAADVAGHVTLRRARIIASVVPEITELGGGWLDHGAWRVRCQARDPDLAGGVDSLAVTLEASFDAGSTWRPVDVAAESAPRPDERSWTVEFGDLGEPRLVSRSPLVVRACVRDRSGLEAMRTWAVMPDSTSGAAPIAGEVRWRRDWLEVECAAPAPLAGSGPRAMVENPTGDRRPLAVEQLDLTHYRFVLRDAQLPAEVRSVLVEGTTVDGRRVEGRLACAARVVRSGHPARIDDLDPSLRIDIPAGALAEDVALRAERQPATVVALGLELEPVGLCVAVEPRSAAFDRPFSIALRPPGSDPTGVGLFTIDDDGEPRLLSGERTTDDMISGTTRTLTTFALLRDTTPPRIGPVHVARHRGRSRLRMTVADAGAGLDDGGIVVEIDGARAIPEWDPETGDVTVEPEDALTPGAHKLRVVAMDALGNRAERVQSFRVQ